MKRLLRRLSLWWRARGHHPIQSDDCPPSCELCRYNDEKTTKGTLLAPARALSAPFYNPTLFTNFTKTVALPPDPPQPPVVPKCANCGHTSEQHWYYYGGMGGCEGTVNTSIFGLTSRECRCEWFSGPQPNN